MIYVYAITRPRVRCESGLAGLENREIFFVRNQRVAAACSLHAEDFLQPSPENLWRHEQVAESLLARDSMLPVRFATTFASEQVLRQILKKHRETLVAGLNRVQGCVELGLRVLWQSDETTEVPGHRTARESAACSEDIREAPGRQYMLRRLGDERRRWQQQARAERIAAVIRRSLAPLVRQQTERLLITPRMLLTTAYLVERDRIGTIREHVRALGTQYPDLQLLCTGPWPPYHFAPSLHDEHAHVEDFTPGHCRKNTERTGRSKPVSG